MSKKHSIPEYFIEDMKAVGWTAKVSRFEGGSGVFTRHTDNLIIVSYAQFREAKKNRPEFSFKPNIAIGTRWFKKSFKNIAGYSSADGWFINNIYFDFTSSEYSREFIEISTHEIVDFAKSINLREAMEILGNLRGAKRPPNAPLYVVAKAILGHKEELKELAENVAAGTDEVVSNLVKLEHLEHAIDCCDNPSKYGYPADVIKYMRGS